MRSLTPATVAGAPTTRVVVGSQGVALATENDGEHREGSGDLFAAVESRAMAALAGDDPRTPAVQTKMASEPGELGGEQLKVVADTNLLEGTKLGDVEAIQNHHSSGSLAGRCELGLFAQNASSGQGADFLHAMFGD